MIVILPTIIGNIVIHGRKILIRAASAPSNADRPRQNLLLDARDTAVLELSHGGPRRFRWTAARRMRYPGGSSSGPRLQSESAAIASVRVTSGGVRLPVIASCLSTMRSPDGVRHDRR
jgi:hypothetical protein